MKNNRLFGIIYILLAKDSVTAKYLADYFEVSLRTIYRDIDTLSSLNIPIYACRGKNGGIGLLNNFKLDKALLTKEEQTEILFSLQSIDELNINDSNLFLKMKTIFESEGEDWFSIDFNTWNNSDLHKDNFEILKKAILNNLVVLFTYFNSYGEVSSRKVEPLKLHFKYNAWYLDAYDIIKKDFRYFKLMRIKDLVLTSESFDRKKIPEVFKKVIPPLITTITLEIESRASYRVYDEFAFSDIKKLDNGNFEVTFSLPENEWLYGYILSFGSDAKVISPERIKNIIKTKLEESLKNYK